MKAEEEIRDRLVEMDIELNDMPVDSDDSLYLEGYLMALVWVLEDA